VTLDETAVMKDEFVGNVKDSIAPSLLKKVTGVVEFRNPQSTNCWNGQYKDRQNNKEIEEIEENMKYICLGYIEPNKLETMSETERNAMVDECFTYDDELRKNGHFAGGEALQGPQTATTLRWKNGKVSITDGPYAETKEADWRNPAA
jgi:hypothetical protein